ncbi:hypothetical protein PsorP6_003136 [Peronosclerospora sorghi]|uniref:Uncharacterized protein n=1 Tax=Peronosclerospora sorghi TaxID=230839 RepID=A0ACC0VPB5_9STRA|nr:hypothetical protein PsorP6_003136 [Peronosclerospora sorghi]
MLGKRLIKSVAILLEILSNPIEGLSRMCPAIDCSSHFRVVSFAATHLSMENDKHRCCWHEKVAYEHCFDKWYTNVFLQQKAEGKLGCQEEYKVYMRCFMNELEKLGTLTESIKSTMEPEGRERFEAHMAERR